MKLQKLYLSTYKLLGFAFLAAMVIGIAVYAFTLGFYSVNTTWAAPIVLSPSQERVLAFQPQVVTLETTLDKQLIDKATAVATVQALSDQVMQVNQLLARLRAATALDATQLAAAGKQLEQVLKDKRVDIQSAQLAATEVNKLLKQVDDELHAKLITSDQAATRRITLQGALGSITDSRAQAIQLEQQAREASQAAATLHGGSFSMTALTAVKQATELRALMAQLSIQLATAEATVTALSQSISELERVIATARRSPFYRALREEVTVAFVPYSNLENAVPGAKVYDCYLQIIGCHLVGEVQSVYEAEEYARHPLFKTDLKGKLVEIKFTDPSAAKSQVIFINGKPLLL